MKTSEPAPNNVARYPVEVFWSDEDEGFIAIAPDLPGASAWGETQPEAMAELQDSIAAWIEAAQAAGNPVPAPSRPKDLEQFSGKLLLRIPKQLHADLVRAANEDGVSTNQYLVYLLTKRLTEDTASGATWGQDISDWGTVLFSRIFAETAASWKTSVPQMVTAISALSGSTASTILPTLTYSSALGVSSTGSPHARLTAGRARSRARAQNYG